MAQSDWVIPIRADQQARPSDLKHDGWLWLDLGSSPEKMAGDGGGSARMSTVAVLRRSLDVAK
jgi:hypothetical protein